MVFALLLLTAAPTPPKSHEQALYAALASHFASLQPGEVERLNMFQRTDARQALKLLGAEYVQRYPHGEHVAEVELNRGRAYFEDGQYEEAAPKLQTFALAAVQVKAAQLTLSRALEGATAGVGPIIDPRWAACR